MMKFSNVKEALDMLVIFNGKDSSPDYIVDEDGNRTPITVEEVKSMNMEAIEGLAELLGIDVHDDETINGEQANQLIKKVQARVKKFLKTWVRITDLTQILMTRRQRAWSCSTRPP